MSALVSSGMSRSSKTRRSRRANSRRRLKSPANTLETWFAAAMICGKRCNELISRPLHQRPSQLPYIRVDVSEFGSILVQLSFTHTTKRFTPGIGVRKELRKSRCNGTSHSLCIYMNSIPLLTLCKVTNHQNCDQHDFAVPVRGCQVFA